MVFLGPLVFCLILVNKILAFRVGKYCNDTIEILLENILFAMYLANMFIKKS